MIDLVILALTRKVFQKSVSYSFACWLFLFLHIRVSLSENYISLRYNSEKCSVANTSCRPILSPSEESQNYYFLLKKTFWYFKY